MRKKIRTCIALLRNTLCVVVILLVFLVYKMKNLHRDEIRGLLPKNALKFIDFEEQYNPIPIQIQTMKEIINKYNNDERVLNLDIYGALEPDSPVLVIFVDKYRNNLKYLIASLQNVLGISDAVLIFSHSYFDENANNLVKLIDFTRVIQIFYPYSLQLNPEEFPSYRSGDCPRYMNVKAAKRVNCTGAHTPDMHGRYRDPQLAQLKHFRWWTFNTVFEKISFTKNHSGIFIFLDDDLFLMEDFIFMTMQMQKVSKFICHCDLISLDTAGGPYFLNEKSFGVNIRIWYPKQPVSVLAFDSNVWDIIASHYELFCDVDDYSWFRSLFYVSLNRQDGNRFKVISTTMPRAYKTSPLSDAYNQFEEMTILETVSDILDFQREILGNLFPTQLEVYLNIELNFEDFVVFDYVDNNGGWGDPRDKKMCSNMTKSKIKKVLLDMNNEFVEYYRDERVDTVDDTA